MCSDRGVVMNWIERRNAQVETLKEYASDIDTKLSICTEALSELARGYGIGKDHDHKLNMQRLAASALERIAKMKQRQKPYIWWA